MNIFRKIKASLRLKEAIRRADEAHDNTGERYYVMPMSESDGQLIIMDRKNFRKLKQKHYINQKSFVSNLEKECFYCTPYKNGSGELTPSDIKSKQEQYFLWVDWIKSKRRKKGL